MSKLLKDPTKVKALIKEFFIEAEKNKFPLTLPALAEHLTCTTDDIITYPKEGAAISVVMNHAKLKCENWLMTQMVQGRIDKSMAALILKMHFGYSDSAKKKESKRSISSILDDEEDNG